MFFQNTEREREKRNYYSPQFSLTSDRIQECTDRPRKIGARWSGKDIKPDEIIQEVRRQSTTRSFVPCTVL
jgi:hypothetical protein